VTIDPKTIPAPIAYQILTGSVIFAGRRPTLQPRPLNPSNQNFSYQWKWLTFSSPHWS